MGINSIRSANRSSMAAAPLSGLTCCRRCSSALDHFPHYVGDAAPLLPRNLAQNPMLLWLEQDLGAM